MNTKELTITIELNQESIAHILNYVQAVYHTPHRSDGEPVESEKCAYCITFLLAVEKASTDIALKKKINELRVLGTQQLKEKRLRISKLTKKPLGEHNSRL